MTTWHVNREDIEPWIGQTMAVDLFMRWAEEDEPADTTLMARIDAVSDEGVTVTFPHNGQTLLVPPEHFLNFNDEPLEQPVEIMVEV